MEIEIEDAGMGGGLHSQGSDLDLAAVAEKEYKRMKRQYFLMQHNRRSLVDKAGPKVTSSKRLLNILQTQRDNLERNISAATSPANQRKDEDTKEKIRKLLQLYEKHKAQATQLSKEIQGLETTMRKVTKKFYKARLLIMSKVGSAVPIGMLERSLDNHDNKLHMIKSNYDTLMAENRQLKEEISTMINRRFVIFRRLEILHSKMSDCKHDMNSKVDEALQMYNMWDDAQKRINFIKDKYKDDVRQHLLEVKEYDRLLFHDLKEIRFYLAKNKPRDLLMDAKQKLAHKSKKETNELLKEIRRYEKYFQRLEEFDPSRDVDVIISKCKLVEQRNFANVQQISDFNKDNMKLMEEIQQLRAEVDILAEETEARAISNAEELTRLEYNRKAEIEKLEFMKMQLDVNDESLQRIFTVIEAFTQSAECDLAPLQNFLGSTEKVTKKNLTAAMGLLEQQIASIQLERELLIIQKDHERSSTPSVSTAKANKTHRASGGPFPTQLVIPGRPELGMGMGKKDDEEDPLFTPSPVPKSVHREQVVSQLRDTGVIQSPKNSVTSESIFNLQAMNLGANSGQGQGEDDKSLDSRRATAMGGSETDRRAETGRVKFGETSIETVKPVPDYDDSATDDTDSSTS